MKSASTPTPTVMLTLVWPSADRAADAAAVELAGLLVRRDVPATLATDDTTASLAIDAVLAAGPAWEVALRLDTAGSAQGRQRGVIKDRLRRAMAAARSAGYRIETVCPAQGCPWQEQ